MQWGKQRGGEARLSTCPRHAKQSKEGTKEEMRNTRPRRARGKEERGDVQLIYGGEVARKEACVPDTKQSSPFRAQCSTSGDSNHQLFSCRRWPSGLKPHKAKEDKRTGRVTLEKDEALGRNRPFIGPVGLLK
jgi:hypothetical protein